MANSKNAPIKDMAKKDKIEKLTKAQQAMANADKQEQEKKNAAYKKYTPAQKSVAKRIAHQMPTWAVANIAANAAMFLLGSLMWLHDSNTHAYDPDYDSPDGPYSGALLDRRTYKQAVKDAYWPIVDGEFAPDINWQFTSALIVVMALLSLGGTVAGAVYDRKKDIKNARRQIDVMLEIEKLAKQHNMDAVAAKKMLTVAPEIVKHMSADSRVYFDMILDGHVNPSDRNFVNMATAVMVGHLQSHPEDLDKVMAVLDENSIPATVLRGVADKGRE